MCGRVTITAPASEIQDLFSIQQSLFEPKPRYNASPGQMLPVVTVHEGIRTLEAMEWGLHYQGYKTPAQKKAAAAAKEAQTGKPQPKPKLAPPPINASFETVLENFAFRFSIIERRCILPADGWYEWPEFEGEDPETGKVIKEKWAYRCHFKDNRLFGMPAVWDHWTGDDGKEIHSFAVITGQPSLVGGEIHNRQPMFLPNKHIDAWLSIDTPAKDAVSLLISEPGNLEAYPVSRAVGSYANEGPQLIERIEGKVFG